MCKQLVVENCSAAVEIEKTTRIVAMLERETGSLVQIYQFEQKKEDKAEKKNKVKKPCNQRQR